jgi:hypothetical protein
MKHQSEDQGVAPFLQSACAVIGSLLLVGVLGYAIVVGPGSELTAEQADAIDIALRHKPGVPDFGRGLLPR